MQKFLLFSTLFIGSVSANGWSKQDLNQAERNRIERQIATIKERYNAMGANWYSPAIQMEIKDFLIRIGTPLSYEIYKSHYPNG